jgi:hypothetical protein
MNVDRGNGPGTAGAAARPHRDAARRSFDDLQRATPRRAHNAAGHRPTNVPNSRAPSCSIFRMRLCRGGAWPTEARGLWAGLPDAVALVVDAVARRPPQPARASWPDVRSCVRRSRRARTQSPPSATTSGSTVESPALR